MRQRCPCIARNDRDFGARISNIRKDIPGNWFHSGVDLVKPDPVSRTTISSDGSCAQTNDTHVRARPSQHCRSVYPPPSPPHSSWSASAAVSLSRKSACRAGSFRLLRFAKSRPESRRFVSHADCHRSCERRPLYAPFVARVDPENKNCHQYARDRPENSLTPAIPPCGSKRQQSGKENVRPDPY